MVWLVILMGVVLGFIIAGLKGHSERELSAPRPSNMRMAPIDIPHLPRYRDLERNYLRRRELSRWRTRRLPIQVDLSRLQQTNELNGKELVKNWRISIQGLIRLANSNLSAAKQHLRMKQYEMSVQAASTSVENISRALIHCFGGKPNSSSGQEEALKMLTRRFKGAEKRKFEKAIETIANIGYTNRKLKSLTTDIGYTHTYAYNHYTIISKPLFGEAEVKQILKSASKTFALFRNIIFRHFSPEIPELAETLPGCPRL